MTRIADGVTLDAVTDGGDMATPSLPMMAGRSEACRRYLDDIEVGGVDGSCEHLKEQLAGAGSGRGRVVDTRHSESAAKAVSCEARMGLVEELLTRRCTIRRARRSRTSRTHEVGSLK